MMERNRAALYHRVSTVDQNQTNARGELRKAATLRGLTVELDIEETGSGASNDRPGLLRILEAARRGLIDVVIVYKLDRWGRSSLDLLSNIKALEDAGVRFIAISQGIDIRPGGDAMSRLMLTMLSAVAEFELDLIRDRTRLGLARAKAAGKLLGRRKDPRPSTERVAALRAAGRSWSEVADDLGCSVWVAKAALTEKGARVEAA